VSISRLFQPLEPAVSVKSDFHIHTSFSTCANKDMLLPTILDRCRSVGLEEIGISDHLYKTELTESLVDMRRQIKELGESVPKVYFGSEVGYNGRLNCHPLTLEQKQELGFDYAIGSHHSPYIKEYNVTRLIEEQHRHHLLTCQDPAMDILGHPYRLLYHEFLNLGWPWFCSMNIVPRNFIHELGQAARETGTAVEINTTSNLVMKFNPPQYFEHYVEFLSILNDEGVTFALGSDAHEIEEIDTIKVAWQVVERLKIPAERIWSPKSAANQ